MADKSQNPGAVTNTFNKGMVKDMNETFVGEGLWTHARNLVNNSHDGHTGIVGNEPANLHCVTLPYTLIGVIHLVDDQWAVFTTDDVNSEIGIFDESKCSYEKRVNDPCLNFKRSHLITGASRKRFDCELPVYWADGLNPDRFIDLDNIPFKYTETEVDNCKIKKLLDPLQLDCEKIRLAPLIQHPCLVLNKGKIAGTLPNGSYQAVIAYSQDGVRLTSYVGITEVQSLFIHENVRSSLELSITSIDTTYDEFELVIIGRINGTTVAKKIGYYSTSQSTIYIDRWDQEFETVPISQVVFRGEPAEKSDAIYEVNNYLIKVGDYSKFKFNYQLQANKIVTEWVTVQYPSNYYAKGGNNTGYMRDEQYAFFIRWIYNTGERSESYHIPGRAATTDDRTSVFGGDAFETIGPDAVTREKWQVYNTATLESTTSYTLADGGRVVATGKMGYWESTEEYPDDKLEIWGELCGKKIRHHKMPDETVNPLLSTFTDGGEFINILGVQFSNITHPLDNYGNPITSIVGYEILRSSREGNRSIIGKGLFNNMREYTIPDQTIKGLFQNYPYNDLRPDSFLTEKPKFTGDGALKGQVNVSTPRMSGYKKNIFSFHSPEVTFSNPFLNPNEVKLYQEVYGTSYGKFEIPWKHPKFKIVSNFADIMAKVLGLVSTLTGVLSVIGGGLDFKFGSSEDVPITYGITLDPNYAGDMALGLGTGGSPITYGQWIAATGSNGLIIGTLIQTGILTHLHEQQYLRLFFYMIPKRQYAAQYNSHGFYNQSKPSADGNRRRRVKESAYIPPAINQFNLQYIVHNTNRSKVVVVETEQDYLDPSVKDDSRVTMGDVNANLYQTIPRTISSYYGSLKISIPSQYGQLDGVKQFPINGGCIFDTIPDKTKTFSTPTVLFNGDIYINRFTEKNSMFFFTDWLMGEPDRTEWDYTLYVNIPYPRFWINNVEEHVAFFNLPDDYRALDRRDSGFLHVKRGYFYLFNSGVRDFFVESEINLGYRDWEDEVSKRHYDIDRYTDLYSMFRSDVIKSGNYYKYDYNLSITKLFNSHVSWGIILGRDYDPKVAESCYIYRPSRVRYSLLQQMESRKDNWRMFLTNNYKDFETPVTSIKSVNKTGALFMMARQSPMQFMGVEELKLDGTGAKITIGDGALFNQPMQSITNAETSFEYGSCQNKFAVMNIPWGVFWVSQNQGKVFQYASNLDEISRNGMKWWFAKYLPSELLKVYPDYPLYDNPVAGVGVQMMYDNTHEILYITKKDYKPKRTDLKYEEGGFYYIDGFSTVTTGSETIRTCPAGYSLVNNQCVKIETAEPVQTGQVVQLSRTPYEVYGNLGTRLYDTASVNGTFTALNTGNTFWIRQASPGNWASLTADQKQAYDLNNGPVNRLAVWGRTLDSNGNVLNNYNHSGQNLNPVGQWIGFDVCVNITETKTYYVCIAADNRYRMFLDGTLVLEDQSSLTRTFNYLHIFPVTITAGNHTLRVEGFNDALKAAFGCEIFDLSNLPSGNTVVQFLNAQTDYTNLGPRTIFTTRTATTFSSNLYSCPTGYGLLNPTCDEPICQRTLTIAPTVTIKPGKTETFPNKVYAPFTNTSVWEDASWTISYDPKIKAWLSFHDWKPTFMLPSKTHFMSVNRNSIWKHNVRCDLFCNFYGTDYPFDVEFVSATGQTVTSVRNVEYLLEAYKFYNDCADKFHILDQNFDNAMIYNSEQISGVLELILKDKRNPHNLLNYPQVGAQSIKINFSKEENKYRFNQFWDITKDRGEFSGAQLPMFITKANGYEYFINPQYINYQKAPVEHKKFRHNVNRVFLRKMKSGDVKLLLKLSNQKILPSPR